MSVARTSTTQIGEKPVFSNPVPRPEARVRLFCFPHAGGAPVAFFPWSEALGPAIECVSVQYPGRAQRLQEPPFHRVEDVVAEVAGAFERQPERWMDRRFAFYGHSFGAIVAFELVRRLRREGRPLPEHLFVGAARAPHLGLPFAPIHGTSDAEFLEQIQTRYGGIPEAIARHPELVEIFLPAMRADFTAYETYRSQEEAPFEMPITAWVGDEDRAVTPEGVEAWAQHTRGPFVMNILAGGHFFPTANLQKLASDLQVCLRISPTPAV